MWSINHVLASDRCDLAGCHAPNRAHRRFADSGSWNRVASDRSHAIDRDTTVDDGGFVNGVIIDNGRVIVNASHFSRSQTPMAEVAFPEIMNADKSEMIGAEAEIKVDPYVQAIEAPAGSNLKHRARRQRRPTTVVA